MKKVVMLDGAAGTSLWEKATDKVPVWRYNIENPRIVRELNEEYVEAGADIILANTFAGYGAEGLIALHKARERYVIERNHPNLPTPGEDFGIIDRQMLQRSLRDAMLLDLEEDK